MTKEEEIKELDKKIEQLERQALELNNLHHQFIGRRDEAKDRRKELLDGKREVPKKDENDSTGK